jgi:hypothetical protein
MQQVRIWASRVASWLALTGVSGMPACAQILGVEEAQCTKQGCPGVVAAPAVSTGKLDRPEAGGGFVDGDVASSSDPDAALDAYAPKDKLQACSAYCRLVTSNCERQLPQYKNETGCNVVCQDVLETATDPNTTQGNTIECRLEEAEAAGAGSNVELLKSCAAAGLMGTTCGGECANYCSFMQSFCPDDFDANTCLTTCGEVPRSEKPYSDRLPYADHLECRFAHIQLAAAAADSEHRALHCGHAAGKVGPCASKATLCRGYCAEVVNDDGCGKELPQYKNEAGCYDLCIALFTPAAETDGEDLNTIECRTLRAADAVKYTEGVPENCVSAGPVGTACGGACKNYCTLMKSHCAEAYAGIDDCVATCEEVPRSPEPYSTMTTSGNNLECRFAHIQLATLPETSSKDHLMHCGHAAGGPGPCEKPAAP